MHTLNNSTQKYVYRLVVEHLYYLMSPSHSNNFEPNEPESVEDHEGRGLHPVPVLGVPRLPVLTDKLELPLE